MTRKKTLKFAAIVSFSIALVSSLLAFALRSYTTAEIAIIRFVYAMGDWLELPMIIITQAGSPWLIFGIVIALSMLHYHRDGLRLLLAGGITYVVVSLMKIAIMRPRPFLELSDVISRELSISGNGFPSGHSAIAACIAVGLWYVIKSEYKPWLVMGVVLVGVSRIYLGVHSPLDVIGGVSVGIFVSSLVYMLPSFLKGVKTK